MSKRAKKIIVNVLTLSRIVGAFFLPVIFSKTNVLALFVLLSVLFLTDFFDGKLSRRWGVQTVGGMLLDPLGDKVLAISCIFALVYNHAYLWLLLALELAICTVNLFRIIRGDIVSSSFIGKFKNWVLSITLVIGVINLYDKDIVNVLFSAVGISTSLFTASDELVLMATMLTAGCELVTIACYVKEGLDARKKGEFKNKKFRKTKEILMRLFDEEKFSKDRDKALREIIREK